MNEVKKNHRRLQGTATLRDRATARQFAGCLYVPLFSVFTFNAAVVRLAVYAYAMRSTVACCSEIQNVGTVVILGCTAL